MNTGTRRSKYTEYGVGGGAHWELECLGGEGEAEVGEEEGNVVDGEQGSLPVLCWGTEGGGPSEGSLKRF